MHGPFPCPILIDCTNDDHQGFRPHFCPPSPTTPPPLRLPSYYLPLLPHTLQRPQLCLWREREVPPQPPAAVVPLHPSVPPASLLHTATSILAKPKSIQTLC